MRRTAIVIVYVTY